jgi:hypothetical protein
MHWSLYDSKINLNDMILKEDLDTQNLYWFIHNCEISLRAWYNLSNFAQLQFLF